ncbi:MAG: leucine-rich repeat protein [Clostridia bacterium]|nr:leucine-rich repeat protein [Clostridia bacterium]
MDIKKIISLLLAAVIACASLCACSGGSEGGGTGAEETSDAEIDTSPVEIQTNQLSDVVSIDLDLIPPTPAEEFTYVRSNGEVTVTAYVGERSDVCVPAQIENAPVTAIGDGAFADLESLHSLILPESITDMGEGILRGCDALCALQTPLLGEDAVSEQFLGYLFGAETFRDNPRDVPASVQFLRLCGEADTLSAYALYDCNDLLAVDLGGGIKTLQKFSLYRCTALRLILGLEAVTNIEENALMQCSSLVSAELGDALRSIGFGAFEGCSGLSFMRLPFVGGSRTENTYLAYIFGASAPDFAKGYYPKKLAKIELSPSCTSLGDYAFFACEGLKEITLGDTLESIGVRAFYGCISLWSVALPDSLTTLRESAFFGCDSLLLVDFGTGLQEMGINAFYQCDSLTTVVLPKSLKALPASAFAGCISLTNVDLGGVLEVGAQAFRHCDAITSVRAKEGVCFGAGNESLMNVLQNEGK